MYHTEQCLKSDTLKERRELYYSSKGAQRVPLYSDRAYLRHYRILSYDNLRSVFRDLVKIYEQSQLSISSAFLSDKKSHKVFKYRDITIVTINESYNYG